MSSYFSIRKCNDGWKRICSVYLAFRFCVWKEGRKQRDVALASSNETLVVLLTLIREFFEKTKEIKIPPKRFFLLSAAIVIESITE